MAVDELSRRYDESVYNKRLPDWLADDECGVESGVSLFLLVPEPIRGRTVFRNESWPLIGKKRYS